ncbi:MAG: DUF4405 domain-containing protein [Betaproteobacteria bacterium]|nr:DUF4405 domain-containing protein [Betaproteobacteria bacterium]
MLLPASLRYALYIAWAVLLATGIAWLATDAAAIRGFALKVHGAATMAVLALAGAAVALHTLRAWQEGKNRTSGYGIAALVVALAASGWGLYYLGDDSARSLTSTAHWIVGLASPLVFAAHAWLGRRARRLAARG